MNFATMKKMSPRLLHYLDENPDFVTAIHEAAQRPDRTAVSKLELFEDDPFSLYAGALLAWSRGVNLTLLAPDRRPPKDTTAPGKARR